MLLSAFSSGATRYYGRNRLGSITAMVDTGNAIDNLYRYDPPGNRTTNSGTAVNPWKFSAEYQSTSTGLYDFGARTYDPGTSRFTQPDPLPASLSEGLSRYAYAGCNPVNFVDPNGQWGFTAECALFAADSALLVAGALVAGTTTSALIATTAIGLAGVFVSGISLALAIDAGDAGGGLLGLAGVAASPYAVLEAAGGFLGYLGIANAAYGLLQCAQS